MTLAKKKVPFAIDRKSADGLAEQMTNLLRQAIVSGYYKAGDVLPTILEWSKLLKVSIRVPEAAVSMLVKEGLITARKRYGCVVSARRNSVWIGRVLAIVPDGDHVYDQNVLVGRLRTRLSAEGYMFTQVTVVRGSNGRYACAQLDHELRMKPDIALLIGNRDELEARLSRSGVSFGVIGAKRCTFPNAVVNMIWDAETAVADFVAHCVRAGVKRVMQVTKASGRNFDARQALSAAGVKAEEWATPVMTKFGRAEGTQRGAMHAFRRRFEKEGRDWLPDLILFTDDYVAAGALPSLLMAGVRIPEDVRVVSLSNRGLGPVYPMDLTRMENDGAQQGEAFADAVVAFLDHRKCRNPLGVGLVYVPGESFPAVKSE